MELNIIVLINTVFYIVLYDYFENWSNDIKTKQYI